MSAKQMGMKPQDVVILLKVAALNRASSDGDSWHQLPLSKSLKMSQSEVSQSVSRSKYAGLLDAKGKTVMIQTFLEFVQYGISVVFPVKPGPLVRGVPTAHSIPLLKEQFISQSDYVWPYAKGNIRGQAITPLYSTVPSASIEDEELHILLALTDAIRVGRARERNIAIKELESRLC